MTAMCEGTWCAINDGSGRRSDRLVVIRGLPGHPLHPPLTGATIGTSVLAGGLGGFGLLAIWLQPGGIHQVVACLGFGMLALWLQRRQAAPVPTPAGGGSFNGEGTLPTGQHFPVPIMVLHGLVAATTLVLVLLTALKVGGS